MQALPKEMKNKMYVCFNIIKRNKTNYIKYLSFAQPNSVYLIQYYMGFLQYMQWACQQDVESLYE